MPDGENRENREDRDQGSGESASFVSMMRGLTDALTSATGRFTGTSGSGGSSSGAPGIGPLRLPPMPGALSAQQLAAVVEEVRKRRAEVQALRESLTLFDEQLEAFETSLGPLVEWSRNWADLERSFTEMWPRGWNGSST